MPTLPLHEANAAIHTFHGTVRALLGDLHFAQGCNNRVGAIGAVTRIGAEALELLAYLNTLPFPLEWIPAAQWGKSL